MKPGLIYISPLPFTSFAQRPHHFVRWWQTRTQGQVLWINSYPARLPKWQDITRLTVTRRPQTQPRPTESAHWITVITPKALPIEPLKGLRLINRWLWQPIIDTCHQFAAEYQCLVVVAKPCELALTLIKHHPNLISLMDIMDDFPNFYQGISKAHTLHCEQAIADRVTMITVSSSALYKRFCHYDKKVTTVLNGLDLNTLNTAKTHTPTPRTTIGYLGTIGDWFDWPLVLALARQYPELPFQLVGPCYVKPTESLPDNITLLGEVSHHHAMEIMSQFTVGLIPFKCTPLTACVDPIKYYEYLGLGVPVVATAFGEMAHRHEVPGVFIIDDHQAQNHALEHALSFQFEQQQTHEFRTVNNWPYRFNQAGLLE